MWILMPDSVAPSWLKFSCQNDSWLNFSEVKVKDTTRGGQSFVRRWVRWTIKKSTPTITVEPWSAPIALYSRFAGKIEIYILKVNHMYNVVPWRPQSELNLGWTAVHVVLPASDLTDRRWVSWNWQLFTRYQHRQVKLYSGQINIECDLERMRTIGEKVRACTLWRVVFHGVTIQSQNQAIFGITARP
jgi:hypothetical protein